MAKGISLTLLIIFKKKRIEIKAKTNALMKPAIKKGSASTEKYSRFFINDRRLAPAMMGTAMIKVKSAAARCDRPSSTPPEMVEPERENPGQSEKHCINPIDRACL